MTISPTATAVAPQVLLGNHLKAYHPSKKFLSFRIVM